MKIIDNKAFFGPNLHVDFAVNYLEIDLEGGFLSQNHSKEDFLTVLDAIFPKIADSLRASKDFSENFQNVQTGEDLEAATFVAFLLGFFLEAIGEKVSFNEIRSIKHKGYWLLLFTTPNSEVGLHCGEWVVKLLNSHRQHVEQADAEQSKELTNDWGKLSRYAAVKRPSMTTQALLTVASERAIPSIKFDYWPFVKKEAIDSPGNMTGLIQLGQGKYQQLLVGLLKSPVVAQTLDVLTNPHLFNSFFDSLGFPVPLQDREFTHINNAKRVLRSAKKIGYPVVIKPKQGSRGNGIFININSDESLAEAYEKVKKFDRHVVIERYIKGESYCLFIIGESVHSVYKINAQSVMGDGRNTLNDLIDKENEVRRAKSVDDLSLIEINEALLDRIDFMGWSLNSIPSDGETIPLNIKENSFSIGTDQDFLPKVHNQILELAVRASKALSLDIACVKMICTDLSKPLMESKPVIIGISPPDLSMYRMQDEKLPLTVANRCLDYLFPAGNKTHIPTIAITGTNGKTTTCLLVAHIFKTAGRMVGVACSNGIYFDGKLVKKGIYSGIAGALQIYHNDTCDCAVLETSRGTLIEKGLAFPKCEVSACLNIASDHLGEKGVETLADLARVKRLVIEKARDWAVINGEDDNCLSMIPYVTAEKLCLVAFDPQTPAVKDRLALGGAAVVLEQNQTICFYSGSSRQHVIDLADVPAVWDGAARHNVQNVMFSIAIALGSGVKLDVIRQALTGFSSSIAQTPGRLNVYQYLPFKVVIDYAHNGHGFRCLCEFVRSYHQAGKKILICFAQERHSDNDMHDIASSIAGEFDHYICRDPFGVKTHEVGEVSALLKEKLLECAVPEQKVEVIPDFDEALITALELCKPGDCLVVGATSRYQHVWDKLEKYRLEHYGSI